MSIEQAFKDEMKRCMKAREQATLDVVRMIRSKIQEATTAKGFTGEITDALYVEVIQRYVKQMTKALPDYEAQGERGAAMVSQLKGEIDYLSQFLPTKLSREETLVLTQAAIEALGVTNPSGMGQVMGRVIGANRDAVDPALVKACALELLKS